MARLVSRAWVARPGDLAKTYSCEQTVHLLENAGDCLLVMDSLEKVQDTGTRGGAAGRIVEHQPTLKKAARGRKGQGARA